MSQDSWEQLLKEADELDIGVTLDLIPGSGIWTLSTSVGWGYQKGTLLEMQNYLRETIIHIQKSQRVAREKDQ